MPCTLSTHIVNLPSVPKFCAVDPVCKVACTLSGNSYITCQASSASPCAHAVTASLDSEVYLGHASGAIQHFAPQSDVNEMLRARGCHGVTKLLS